MFLHQSTLSRENQSDISRPKYKYKLMKVLVRWSHQSLIDLVVLRPEGHILQTLISCDRALVHKSSNILHTYQPCKDVNHPLNLIPKVALLLLSCGTDFSLNAMVHGDLDGHRSGCFDCILQFMVFPLRLRIKTQVN